tara:strand:+ start:1019 stop:1408 length:390 start_codon:yes stop_codon:yes gene_type:complete
MKAIVQRAKIILSELYEFDVKHFDNKMSRKANITKGRRFLMFFLRESLNMSFNEIISHCPAVTNHATAIHHIKRMKDELEIYWALKEEYTDFKCKMLEDENYVIETQIAKRLEERKQINNELYKLKKLL